MTNTYTKPNLPDPGHDRWWSITRDDDTWYLELNEDVPNYPYRESGVIESKTIYDHKTLSAYDFEKAAREILERLAKDEAFMGTYHKQEEN